MKCLFRAAEKQHACAAYGEAMGPKLHFDFPRVARWTAALCLLRIDALEKVYFTVVIPWDPTKPSVWHPTDANFAPLTRGAFRTRVQAHAWARENLCGGVYTVRAFTGG